jgi:hypothetical protein
MTKDQKLALFAQVNANYPALRETLTEQRAEALKYLIGAGDLVAVHRAQGRVAVLDEFIEMLASAHKHLHK